MNNLKEKILFLRDSRNILFNSIFYTILYSYLFLKFTFNSRYRAEKLTHWYYKNNIHQQSTFTKYNRYPLLFNICKNYIDDKESTKILSFGCSTGEEVKTLRMYFPKSSIIGTDINKYCIKKCKKKYRLLNTFFFHSQSKPFNELKDLDAIFCLAVFQVSENRKNKTSTESVYPFTKFENQIISLDRKLKKGGLFIIDHTDFDFLETSVGKNYKPLDIEGNKIVRTRPIFNKANKKISSSTSLYRIFQKA